MGFSGTQTITVTGGVEPTAVTTAELNFAPAAKNANLTAATTTEEDASYTVATEWFKYEEGTGEVAVETGITAAASTTYTAKMTLTAKHGYAFNNASTVEVNETTTYSVGDGKLALENGKLVLTLSNTTEMVSMTEIDATVSITGTAKIGETLTANVTGLNKATKHYQWKSGGVNVGTDSDTYKVVAADYTKAITVTVTADGYSGSVTSAATAAVEKKVYTGDPAVQPVVKSKTATSITVVKVEGQEYQIYKDGNWSEWQDSATFEGLTAATDYSIVTRVKETEDTKASGDSNSLAVTTCTNAIIVSELVAPAKNAAPDTAVTVSSGMDSDVEWYVGNDKFTGNKFMGDTVYTAKFTVTLSAPHSFDAAVSAGEGYTVTRDSDTQITVSKTFAKTAAKEVTGIAITTPPTKTQYVEGQNFDASGMVVTATYDDDSTEVVTTGCELSHGVMNTADTAVTVTYEGQTAQIPVTVDAKVVTAIEVSGTFKTEYLVKQTADWNGMVVTATYNDGTTKILEDGEYSINGFNTSGITGGPDVNSATRTVTVTAGDKSDTFDITVKKRTVGTVSVSRCHNSGCYYSSGIGHYFNLSVLFSDSSDSDLQLFDGAFTKYYALVVDDVVGDLTTTEPVDAGKYYVYYTFEGNNYWRAVTKPVEAQGTIIIRKAEPNVTVTPTEIAVKIGATSNAVAATVLTDGAGTVSYYIEDSTIATWADGKVTGVKVGTTNLVVTVAEGTNYQEKTVKIPVTVRDLDPQVFAEGFASDTAIEKTYGDAAFTRAATLTTGSGTMTYSSSKVSVATVDANGKVTIVGVGETVITATAAQVDGEYKETSATYTLTVGKKEVGLTWSGYSDLVYDGNAKNVTATATGLVNGDVVAVDVRGGTETNAGENYTATAFALTGEKAGNYKLPETKTKAYTIAPKSLTAANVEVEYASKGYTGNALEPVITVKDGETVLVNGTDYTVAYEDHQYVGTATVTVTMKGNYDGTATKEFEITAVADPAVIDETATVTKGGNTVNLAANVTGAQGDVTYAISGEALGCTVDGNGVFTAGNTSGTVKVTVTVANKNVDGQGAAEYTGKTATITVTVTDKHTGDLTVTQTGCTYGDTEPLADPTYDTITGVIDSRITYTGTLHKGGTYAETTEKPTEAGDYIVTVQLETNTHIYTGTAAFEIAAKSISGMTVTLSKTTGEYTGSEQTVTVASVGSLNASDYDVSGDTSGTDANTYTVTVTGKGNYTGTASADWTITPKAITISGAVVSGHSYTPGKTDVQIDSVTFNGATLEKGKDYTVSGVMADANAGNNKPVTLTVTLRNRNYSLAENTYKSQVTIGKAAAQTLADITMTHKYTIADGEKAIGRGGMTEDAGELTYTAGAKPDKVSAFTVDASGKVTFTLDGAVAGDTITLPVKIDSVNYAQSTVNVVITITEKDTPEVTVSNITMTYNGEPVPASKISGSAKFNSASVAGNWSFEGTAPTNANGDGETVVVVFTPDDETNFAVVKTNIKVTIAKANPTIEVEYTKINQSNKTLADAELKIKTSSVTGTVAWNDATSTKVEANKAYGWTFTPEDTTNYNTVSGELTPYSVMMYEPVYGSAVQAPAATAEGTVALSTPNAVPGATVVVYPRPAQGYKTAGVTVLDAQGNMVPMSVDANGNYSFKMPNSAVQIIPTFVKESAATQSQFVDVPAGAWYEDAVNAAVAKGLFGGMTDTTFAPNTEMSRSMLVTVLWRLAGKPEAVVDIDFDDVQDGLWYSDAVAWAAASGVVTGMTEATFGTNGDITREQMAAMLYRYAKLIGLDTTAAADLSAYKDSGKVSSWAQEAMAWCVANGIIGGVTNDTLAPSGDATRAQVATILVRFCEKFGL